MTERRARIAQIEQAAAEALPCRLSVDDDGWRLRFNDHVTRRCNSVLAGAPGSDPLAQKIERAEAFYRGHGAVPRFQITEASQPAGLTGALVRRGYRERAGARVQTAALAALAARRQPGAPFELRLADAPTPGWLDALALGSGEPPASVAVRARNLAALTQPVAFVEAVRDDAVAAVGLGVASDGWIGLFNMATAPTWRRQGAARCALLRLAAWGQELGAREAYLQVHPANLAAQALYGSLGFVTDHSYAYWEASEGPAAQ